MAEWKLRDIIGIVLLYTSRASGACDETNCGVNAICRDGQCQCSNQGLDIRKFQYNQTTYCTVFCSNQSPMCPTNMACRFTQSSTGHCACKTGFDTTPLGRCVVTSSTSQMTTTTSNTSSTSQMTTTASTTSSTLHMTTTDPSQDTTSFGVGYGAGLASLAFLISLIGICLCVMKRRHRHSSSPENPVGTAIQETERNEGAHYETLDTVSETQSSGYEILDAGLSLSRRSSDYLVPVFVTVRQ